MLYKIYYGRIGVKRLVKKNYAEKVGDVGTTSHRSMGDRTKFFTQTNTSKYYIDWDNAAAGGESPDLTTSFKEN